MRYESVEELLRAQSLLQCQVSASVMNQKSIAVMRREYRKSEACCQHNGMGTTGLARHWLEGSVEVLV